MENNHNQMKIQEEFEKSNYLREVIFNVLKLLVRCLIILGKEDDLKEAERFATKFESVRCFKISYNHKYIINNGIYYIG